MIARHMLPPGPVTDALAAVGLLSIVYWVDRACDKVARWLVPGPDRGRVVAGSRTRQRA